MPRRIRTLLPPALTVIAAVVFLYLLADRYALAVIRYFDMDEYAYLYWSSQMARGAFPFRDFLLFIPPTFIWLLTPVMRASDVLYAMVGARLFAFWIFIALCGAAGTLFWVLRRSWIAVMAALMLLVLPMPGDKFIEVRPDTLAILFAVAGTALQAYWMTGRRRMRFLALAGLMYGLSLAVLQKTLPHIVLAGVFVVWTLIPDLQHGKTARGAVARIVLFGLAVAAPFVAVFTVSSAAAGFGSAWYALTKLPIEAYRMAKDFPIFPWFFFLPNDVYYGTYGYHLGYVANMVVWVVAILFAVLRFFGPAAAGGKEGATAEWFVAAAALLQIFTFLYLVPMKHAQYLLFPAVFVALYGADAVWTMWQRMSRSLTGLAVFAVVWLGLLFVLIKTDLLVNGPKKNWDFRGDTRFQEAFLRAVPRTEYVYDMVGVLYMYPSAYYASALPIGQSAIYMSQPPPPLVPSLESYDVKFIYQGPARRVIALTAADQAYVAEHFTEVGDGRLLVRRDVAGKYSLLFR